MTRRRRKRVRASDLSSPNPRRGLPALIALLFALTVVLLYKASVGEETVDALQQVTGDPAMVLPPSVTSRGDAGAPPVSADGRTRSD